MMATQEANPIIRKAKLVLLGETGTGKSSLASRLVKGSFSRSQPSTIGGEYFQYTLSLDEENQLKFEIWDTAGQERFHSVASMYYRAAIGAFVVYDITSPMSFERAKNWIQELKLRAVPLPIIMLVGNKLDLKDIRAVATEEAEDYAYDEGLLFTEVSAKTAENTSKVLSEIGEEIWTRLDRECLPSGPNDNNNVRLRFKRQVRSKFWSCCCG